MDSFTLIIPNNRYKYVEILQLIILFINAVCFVWLGYSNTHYFFYIVALLIFIHIIFQLQNRRSEAVAVKYIPFSASLLCVIAWMNMQQYFFAFAMAVIVLLQMMVKKKYTVTVNSREVQINTFPGKKFKWSELQNVVLKDGVLTIDRRDNKIIQAEIIADESNADDEKNFNEFCKRLVR